MASTLEVVQAEAIQFSTIDRAHPTDCLVEILAIDAVVEQAWTKELAPRLATAEIDSAS